MRKHVTLILVFLSLSTILPNKECFAVVGTRVAIVPFYIYSNDPHFKELADHVEMETIRLLSKSDIEIISGDEAGDLYGRFGKEENVSEEVDAFVLFAAGSKGAQADFSLYLVKSANGIVTWGHIGHADSPADLQARAQADIVKLARYVVERFDQKNEKRPVQVLDIYFSNTVNENIQSVLKHFVISILSRSAEVSIAYPLNKEQEIYPSVFLTIKILNNEYVVTSQKKDPLSEKIRFGDYVSYPLSISTISLAEKISTYIQNDFLGKATVMIETIPIGAELWIDGQPYGRTPVQVSSDAGIYTLKLVRPGYIPFIQDVAFRNGRSDLRIKLSSPELLNEQELRIPVNTSMSRTLKTGEGKATVIIKAYEYNGLVETHRGGGFSMNKWTPGSRVDAVIGEVTVLINGKLEKRWTIPMGEVESWGGVSFPTFKIDDIVSSIRIKAEIKREFDETKKEVGHPPLTWETEKYVNLKSLRGWLIVERSDIYKEKADDRQIIDIR